MKYLIFSFAVSTAILSVVPITTTINTNLQTTTIINPEKIAICMQPTHMKKKPTTKMKSFFLPNKPHVPTLKYRP